MAKAMIEARELTKEDLERLGVIKHRLHDICETQGLNMRSRSGKLLKKRKGKFLNGVHSSLVLEGLWVLEKLEWALGQRALLPVAPNDEDEEDEEEGEEVP